MRGETLVTIGRIQRAIMLLLSGVYVLSAVGAKALDEANAGLALAREGKYQLAIPHYRAAIALDPHLPGIYLNLGLAYFKLDKFPEAAGAFEQAAKADPGGFQPRVLLGMSYFGCRRFDAAAVQLKQAALGQPDNIELRYKLAESYLWSHQYQNAIEEFRALLAKDPDSAHVHMLLGEVLDAANQEEAATAEFEAAVKARTPEPEAHFALGYLYWKQKRYREAAAEFRAEMAEQPRHTQSLLYLGDSEMHNGDEKSATQYLLLATDLDSTLRLAHLDLGILLSTSNPAQAGGHLREAIRLDPNQPDAHYRLGRLLQAQGREQEAAAEFAKVKELAAREQQPPPLIQIPGRKNEPHP